MSMSEQATELRSNMIRLHTVLGLMLEAGAVVTEEHVKEMTKYMERIGFVNETCLWERVIALLNDGDYKGYTRPPCEHMDAMAARMSNRAVDDLLNVAETLKKLTHGKTYTGGEFRVHLRSSLQYNAELYLKDHPVVLDGPVTIEGIKAVAARNQAMAQYLFDTHPTIKSLRVYNGIIGCAKSLDIPRSAVRVHTVDIDDVSTEFETYVDEKLMPGKTLVMSMFDVPRDGSVPGYMEYGEELKRDISLVRPVDLAGKMNELTVEAKHILVAQFVAGCRTWPKNRMMAAHYATNGTSGVMNLRNQDYRFFIRLDEETGIVSMETQTLAGNTLRNEELGKLFNHIVPDEEKMIKEDILKYLDGKTPIYTSPLYQEAAKHALHRLLDRSRVDGRSSFMSVEHCGGCGMENAAGSAAPFFMAHISFINEAHVAHFPIYLE